MGRVTRKPALWLQNDILGLFHILRADVLRVLKTVLQDGKYHLILLQSYSKHTMIVAGLRLSLTLAKASYHIVPLLKRGGGMSGCWKSRHNSLNNSRRQMKHVSLERELNFAQNESKPAGLAPGFFLEKTPASPGSSPSSRCFFSYFFCRF